MVDYHNMLWTNFNLGRFYGKLREIPIPAFKPDNQVDLLAHRLPIWHCFGPFSHAQGWHVLPWFPLRERGKVNERWENVGDGSIVLEKSACGCCDQLR